MLAFSVFVIIQFIFRLDESDDEEAPSRKRKRAEKAATGEIDEEQVCNAYLLMGCLNI